MKRLRKSIRQVTRRIGRVLIKIIPGLNRQNLTSFIANSHLLLALYYYFKRSYYLEQRSFLLGALQHQQDMERENGFPIYQLIRNIHRIEKGLSARNPRPVFAEHYILETVTALEKVVPEQQIEQPVCEQHTIAWAFDVLAKYFQVVEETPPIQRAQGIFYQVLERTQYQPGERVPYPHRQIQRSTVSYQDLKRLTTQRKSVRWYQNRPVYREDIDRAIEVAALSPSACNRQPFEFRVYDEPERIQQIRELAVGMGGFDDHIPCLVVLVGKQRAYFDERDRHVIYIDGGLAAMSFQFALETLGLTSTCINWPAIYARENALQKLLGLDDDESGILLIAIGHPDPEGHTPFSQKKPLDLLRSYNKT